MLTYFKFTHFNYNMSGFTNFKTSPKTSNKYAYPDFSRKKVDCYIKISVKL